MEITPEELNKLLQETDVYNVVSLEEYLEEVKGIAGMGSPSRELEESELKEELIKSIEELKEQERLVMFILLRRINTKGNWICIGGNRI